MVVVVRLPIGLPRIRECVLRNGAIAPHRLTAKSGPPAEERMKVRSLESLPPLMKVLLLHSVTYPRVAEVLGASDALEHSGRATIIASKERNGMTHSYHPDSRGRCEMDDESVIEHRLHACLSTVAVTTLECGNCQSSSRPNVCDEKRGCPAPTGDGRREPRMCLEGTWQLVWK